MNASKVNNGRASYRSCTRFRETVNCPETYSKGTMVLVLTCRLRCFAARYGQPILRSRGPSAVVATFLTGRCRTAKRWRRASTRGRGRGAMPRTLIVEFNNLYSSPHHRLASTCGGGPAFSNRNPVNTALRDHVAGENAKTGLNSRNPHSGLACRSRSRAVPRFTPTRMSSIRTRQSDVECLCPLKSSRTAKRM
jgi:hypothetical protein